LAVAPPGYLQNSVAPKSGGLSLSVTWQEARCLREGREEEAPESFSKVDLTGPAEWSSILQNRNGTD
jgi:hypothetical protein